MDIDSSFNAIYRGKSVFLTGHTGFKGSWMALWLQKLGAKVTGFALDPPFKPNHWDILGLDIKDFRGDIRDYDTLSKALKKASPAIVFHLAAQPLVRKSYQDPLETWSTNIMGVANLLEACRRVPSISAIIIVTTDKVYQTQETNQPYKETDRIGGHDPYSASKAASEILIDSYRKSFFSISDSPLLASARAGNVIGGGDFSPDRLIPDLVRSLEAKNPLKVRFPKSTRPWQHVLDCLSGYLVLGQKLLEKKNESADAWNFGPASSDNVQVIDVLERLKKNWQTIQWEFICQKHAHEAGLLHLDSKKAKQKLNWVPVWTLDQALKHTAQWYDAWMKKNKLLSHEQLEVYILDAQRNELAWV